MSTAQMDDPFHYDGKTYSSTRKIGCPFCTTTFSTPRRLVGHLGEAGPGSTGSCKGKLQETPANLRRLLPPGTFGEKPLRAARGTAPGPKTASKQVTIDGVLTCMYCREKKNPTPSHLTQCRMNPDHKATKAEAGPPATPVVRANMIPVEGKPSECFIHLCTACPKLKKLRDKMPELFKKQPVDPAHPKAFASMSIRERLSRNDVGFLEFLDRAKEELEARTSPS
jgi:hypothetical protein